MNKIKTIFSMIKEVNKMDKRLIPVCVCKSVIDAVSPFINLWFSAKIIDQITLNSSVVTLVCYICVILLVNFIICFIGNDLGYKYNNYRKLLLKKEQGNIARKLFTIEYQKLEDSDFKDLIHKHADSQKIISSAFLQLAWTSVCFVSGIITIIISLIIIAPLLRIGFTATGDSFLEKPSFLIVIITSIIMTVAVIVLIALRMNKKWYEANEEYTKLDKIFYYFVDLFSNYKTGKEIRIYKEQDLIEYKSTELLLTTGEQILKKASLNAAKNSSIIAIITSVLGFGVYLFIGTKALFGLFTIGNLVLYCGAFMQIVSGFMNLAVTFGQTAQMIPVANYYFDIMHIEDELKYGTQIIDKNKPINIEFKNVSFMYPGSKVYALKNVNIKITSGEKLAIVGRNGSGKTTFIKLLCRFYDVNDGEILINGINVKEYSKESLIDLYSVVFQDFKIFSTTLLQNITAEDKYDNEKLEDVLQKSNLKDRVSSLPKKEFSYIYINIDKQGVEISGGEAQKLALARALYKDAPIVILDEPTAALDPVAESEIYNNFNNLVKNKTSIYISHRLSSCVFCDYIAVFKDSELIEYGTHSELLKAGGEYNELWQSQAQYYTK